ncbi:glycoside hydrolase family 27 protein [Microvirga sp. SRT01]|uniref:Alpha-galactosidase n=1 Tax=Sphingomonas longa TaxID=2778730 RepID=A0ABS2DBP6_9SPHN|nr:MULTISPECIES: glycoside hydrolase family 27 protein [Alphaproteobacteria]MBM6578349.1 glycoside hydrolase family 27 protein [Sphingomonas sp. BT552]MBR7711390.1 glycoside hydrolase family 27 protein [Microvirga sp. SRT01]
MTSAINRRQALAGAALTGSLIAASKVGAAGSPQQSPALLAPRPPMGWNSWNSFATTITEAQARETAAIMRAKLLPFGYDIFTVDIQWYEPKASSYQYNAEPVPAMDGYGRLLPAPNRFPSSADGSGFTNLAADVHAMGMKFGIHLMRGIPRLAVKRNLPVLGTKYRAADIADTSSVCPWNPDMYGVDMRKPGAQAYYDSVFALYASWGVDFVKMDDMSRPYDAHAPEIEGAHQAIVNSRRPMMLSLSPGETPVARGGHVREHAQMWRISDDFWDEWWMLETQFTRLENWNQWRRPGAWPDADMLPLGRLALGQRNTKFTPDEQRTLMTLWSIARSPLIMGGDLRHLDAPTLALLTNREVLAVNQSSTDNQPHFVEDGTRIWSARPEGSQDRYLALFNTSDKPKEVGIDLRWLGLSRPVSVRDLWTGRDAGQATGRVARTVAAHGAELLRLS